MYTLVPLCYIAFNREVGKWSSLGGHNLTFVDLESKTKIAWKYNLSWLLGVDLDSCKVGVKMKLRFLCVGGSKMQSMSLLGIWGHAPQKIFVMLWDWIWCFLRHKIAMLRTGSGSLLLERFHWQCMLLFDLWN